jgi:hypothetical protein
MYLMGKNILNLICSFINPLHVCSYYVAYFYFFMSVVIMSLCQVHFYVVDG